MVNLITGISLLGYSVGAMALVVLMSALNGFETSIFSSYKKTDPDLLITPKRGVVLVSHGSSWVRCEKLKALRLFLRF